MPVSLQYTIWVNHCTSPTWMVSAFWGRSLTGLPVWNNATWSRHLCFTLKQCASFLALQKHLWQLPGVSAILSPLPAPIHQGSRLVLYPSIGGELGGETQGTPGMLQIAQVQAMHHLSMMKTTHFWQVANIRRLTQDLLADLALCALKNKKIFDSVVSLRVGGGEVSSPCSFYCIQKK